jgi:membrane protease YdiL (CAAX protease family)
MDANQNRITKSFGVNMKKTIAVFVALTLLFVAHQLFMYAITSTDIYRLQGKLLHWRYMHQALFFFGVPTLALTVLHRKPSDYAVSWNRSVVVSIGTILGLTLILPIVADLAVGKLQPVRSSMAYVVSTLVFQTIFSGCGEELCFRGMYQGEIDRVWGRRFRIGSTHLGPGIFVGAFFFGLGHLVKSGVVVAGPLDFAAFASAGVIGLFFGFVREFVGCVFIVGFLHASFDTYTSLVQPSIPGQIVHFITIGVVCYLLFSRKIHAGQQMDEASAGVDEEHRASRQ